MKLTPAPKIQFFGDDGLPLSGGKVFTYEQGTTTPLATYSDPAGGSANTNPVILDAYGRASIYIQDLAYTFLVKDSLDVVQGAGGDVPNPAIDTTDFLERTSLTGSAEVPVGSTAQRDGTPTQGYFRFNSTIGHFEGYDGTEWVPFNDESDDEPTLGNPRAEGMAALSTVAGVRSWGYPVLANSVAYTPYISTPKHYNEIAVGTAGGNTITHSAITAVSNDGKDVLVLAAGTFNTSAINGANAIGLVFIARATATQAVSIVIIEEDGDTNWDVPDPATYSSWAFLGLFYNDSSGKVIPYAQEYGEICFLNPATAKVVVAATTTSWAPYTLAAAPYYHIESAEFWAITTAAGVLQGSFNGTNVYFSFSAVANALVGSFLLPSYLLSTIQLKHFTTAFAIKIKRIKLRA